MMSRSVSSLSRNARGWALGLSIVAILAIHISYVLNGVYLLDALCLLLVPAFCLYLFALVIYPLEIAEVDVRRSYYLALFLLAVFLIISWISKSRFAVSTLDDSYHNIKILTTTIKNNFLIKTFFMTNGRVMFMDFAETLWGLFWRFTRWDFVIVLLQSLPLVLLWEGITDFLKKKDVRYPGLLALPVILSLQVLWSQQGSGYVDSTAGIFCGLVLLNVYMVLRYKDFQPSFSRIVGLAILSVLCVMAKPHLFLVAILGIWVSLWSANRYLTGFLRSVVLLCAAVGVYHILFFYFSLWSAGMSLLPYQGKFFTALASNNSGWTGLEGQYFTCHPLYYKLHARHLDFRMFYLVLGWFFDYKYRRFITPDPFVGGNGVLWTYIVVPAMGVFLYHMVFHFKKTVGSFKQPHWLIAAVLAAYWLLSDGSIVSRFSLGFNILLMSWAFGYLWKALFVPWQEKNRMKAYLFLAAFIIIAAGSYRLAINGDMFDKKREGNSLEVRYLNVMGHVQPRLNEL